MIINFIAMRRSLSTFRYLPIRFIDVLNGLVTMTPADQDHMRQLTIIIILTSTGFIWIFLLVMIFKRDYTHIAHTSNTVCKYLQHCPREMIRIESILCSVDEDQCSSVFIRCEKNIIIIKT